MAERLIQVEGVSERRPGFIGKLRGVQPEPGRFRAISQNGSDERVEITAESPERLGQAVSKELSSNGDREVAIEFGTEETTIIKGFYIGFNTLSAPEG